MTRPSPLALPLARPIALTRVISGGLWLLTLLATISYPLIAEAGAGGTSGHNKGGVELLLFLPIFLGYTAYKLLMKRYARRAAAVVLDAAATRDALWEPSALIKHTRDSFITLQERWSKNDIQGSLPLLHPSYRAEYTHNLRAHISAEEVNRVWGVSISEVEIVLARDFEDNDQDLFVAHVSGSMHDAVYRAERLTSPLSAEELKRFTGFELLNQETGEVERFKYGRALRTQGDTQDKTSRTISEYWWFQRQGSSWLLKDITKDNAAISSELSLDAESITTSAASEAEGRERISAQEGRERVWQLTHRALALTVGLAVTALGYLLYFLIVFAGWRLIFGWL